MNTNYEKCKKVVLKLNDYFNNKNDVAIVEYPSTIKYKSDEYFLYMFYSCLLDYGMRSKIYHKHLSNTYKEYPYIFNPNYVLNINEEELKSIIVNNIHPRYPNIALKKWIELSKCLIKYDSISEYLMSINSFEELNKFISSIKGYGQKTGGLLMRIIYDANICNFSGGIKSIPIDRHDIEISYLTSIIHSKDITNKELIDLSNTYVRACEELNINSSNIDKYLWEIGSAFCNNKNCNECPLNDICMKESD